MALFRSCAARLQVLERPFCALCRKRGGIERRNRAAFLVSPLLSRHEFLNRASMTNQACNGRNDERNASKLLTIPTILTAGRVVAVPVLVAVFLSNQSWSPLVSTAVFVGASVTDWLDGYLARRMKLSSDFGAFLDPVADKLMVSTALVLLCAKPLAAAWLVDLPWLVPLPSVIIIGREIVISAVREWAAVQGGDFHKLVAVDKLGKLKTATQMVGVTLLLAFGDARNGLEAYLCTTGVGVLHLSAGLAVWSLGFNVHMISSRCLLFPPLAHVGLRLKAPRHQRIAAMNGLKERSNGPVLLFDVMGTIVRDPFYVDVPAFFGISMKELLEIKHPTAWIEFEKGLIEEEELKLKFFNDGRDLDLEGLKTCMTAGYEFIEGMEELLSQLKSAGYDMHAFSNYPTWYKMIDEKLKLSDYLNWTLVSCHTGTRKPEQEAYANAVKILQVDASECALIDDQARNVDSAKAAGMIGIRFESANKLQKDLASLGLQIL